MAHYAIIDTNTNIVTNVITGREEDDTEDLPNGFTNWEDYYTSKFPLSYVKRTSYNTQAGKHYDKSDDDPTKHGLSTDQSKAFRKNFAGIGYTFDATRDAFIPPKPLENPSWVLDETSCRYLPPVPYPTKSAEDIENGVSYEWNEDTTSWVSA
tara:strand:- start:838 stop:1296 length:459 start_codon:yes stop_codon:yes gene_type:complete